MTRRIGVVADSHVGEFIDSLPDGVLTALRGCDLILHAGDLSERAVLDRLAEVAPVIAVRGDHDCGGARDLPRDHLVEIAGRRLGLTHGRRAWPVEHSVVLSHVAAGRRLAYRAGLHRALIRRFGPIDCLVYGHWHEPCIAWLGGVLCFSPGAVCPWGSLQDDRRRIGVVDAVVRRYRRQLGREAMRPRVGILDVRPGGGIRARSIPID